MSFWDDDELKKAAEGGGYHKLEAVGDTVTGTVRKLMKRKFANNDGSERTAVEIEFDDDSKLTAGQVLLLRDLYVMQPTAGEHLTITLADVKKQGIKTTKFFRIEVVRADGTVDKVDQTES
jgi:hypothetical protein